MRKKPSACRWRWKNIALECSTFSYPEPAFWPGQRGGPGFISSFPCGGDDRSPYHVRMREVDFESFCSGGGPGDDEACRKYCSLVSLNDTIQARAAELFEMSVESPGAEGFPGSLLPLCRFQGGGTNETDGRCWRRVANHHGVCFAKKTGLWQKKL